MKRAQTKWIAGLCVIMIGAVVPWVQTGRTAETPATNAIMNITRTPEAGIQVAATTNTVPGTNAEQAVLELNALLNSKGFTTAWSALASLQDLLPRDQWPALYVRLLTNSHHQLRSFAARQIVILGSDGSNCVPALVGSLADENINVRQIAMGTLMRLVPDLGTVATLVADRLEAANSEQRIHFIQLLGRMSELPKPVLHKVVKYADSPDEKLRIAVSQFRYYHPEALR